MVRLSVLLSGLCALASASASNVKRASLQQVTNSGISNPTNVGFYIYVPDKLATNPGVMVALHYCQGTAQAYYSGSPWAGYANKHGFVLIFPSSPNSGTCWDLSSKKTLTHNGGGDSTGIANMAIWAINKYKADPNKVWVVGGSSGAMMTNVMAATYPDLFKAGIAYAGVPAGCFVSSSGGVAAWNSTCAQGKSINTPATWANVVKGMYPGYSGARPRMLINHGSADTTVYPNNWNETIKQWAGVFGYDYTRPVKTEPNVPRSNVVKYTYGDNLQGVYALGVGHNLPTNGDSDMTFLGVDAPFNPPATTSKTPVPTQTPSQTQTQVATPTPSSPGGTVPQWGQCGGSGYTGPTVCVSPFTCKYSNDWYSQCV